MESNVGKCGQKIIDGILWLLKMKDIVTNAEMIWRQEHLNLILQVNE